MNMELEIDDWFIHVNDFEWIFHIYTKDEILNDLTDYVNCKSDEHCKHTIKNIKLIIEYK